MNTKDRPFLNVYVCKDCEDGPCKVVCNDMNMEPTGCPFDAISCVWRQVDVPTNDLAELLDNKDYYYALLDGSTPDWVWDLTSHANPRNQKIVQHLLDVVSADRFIQRSKFEETELGAVLKNTPKKHIAEAIAHEVFQIGILYTIYTLQQENRTYLELLTKDLLESSFANFRFRGDFKTRSTSYQRRKKYDEVSDE